MQHAKQKYSLVTRAVLGAALTVGLAATATPAFAAGPVVGVNEGVRAGQIQPGDIVSLPDATYDTPYSYNLEGTDGFGALQIIDGALPPGLTFDSALNVFSGTPTRVIAIPISLTMQDTVSLATFEVTIRVAPKPTVFGEVLALSVRAGEPVNLRVVQEPGTDASYSIEYFDENDESIYPPAGLSLAADRDGGLSIVGIPTAKFTGTLKVTESSPYSLSEEDSYQTFTLNITDEPIFKIADGAEISLIKGKAFTQQLADVVPGSEPLDIVGALPAGMAFNGSTGELSGTPTAAGDSTITIGRSLNGQGPVTRALAGPTNETRTLTLSVLGEPAVTVTRMGDATSALRVGERASWLATAPGAEELTAAITPKGGADPVSWIVATPTAAGELKVEGVPAAAGDYVLTVTATNAAGETTETTEFSVAAAETKPGTKPGTKPSTKPGTKPGTTTAAKQPALASTGSESMGVATGVGAALALLAGGWAMIRSRRAISNRSK